MLSPEALPELNRRLDALQAQALARLHDKVRGQQGLGTWAAAAAGRLDQHCRCHCRCIRGDHAEVPALASRMRLCPHGTHHPQGFSEAQTGCQRFLNLRYDGTDVPIMTPAPRDGDYAAAFERAYQVGPRAAAAARARKARGLQY